MPPVDMRPLMNHPAWGSTLTPPQRKLARAFWQDPSTSDSDRTEMLRAMDQRLATDTAARSTDDLYQQVYGSTPPATGGTYTDADVQNALKTLQTPTEATGSPAPVPTVDLRYTPQPRPGVSTEAEARATVDLLRRRVEAGLADQPPSDLVVDIEKTSPTMSPTEPRTWTGEEWDKRMAPMRQQMEETSRAAPAMALSAIPGGLGYVLGTKIAPALGAVGTVVPPLLEAVGGYLGRRAGVKLGLEEEGAFGDVLSALPLVTRGLGSATAGWLERTVKAAPVAVRDQAFDLLGKLFSRGGAQGALTYALSGNPQLAAFVGGSVAVARQLIEFGLRHPIGKQLVEATLKAGRALGGPELGMLMQIGRTGTAPADLEQRRETPR